MESHLYESFVSEQNQAQPRRFSLFTAQGDHRVQLNGLSCRHKTGNKGRRPKHQDGCE